MVWVQVSLLITSTFELGIGDLGNPIYFLIWSVFYNTIDQVYVIYTTTLARTFKRTAEKPPKLIVVIVLG